MTTRRQRAAYRSVLDGRSADQLRELVRDEPADVIEAADGVIVLSRAAQLQAS